MPSQLLEEVTAHAQSDSLEDAREICADGSYFPNNLRINVSFVGKYMCSLKQPFVEIFFHLKLPK